MTYFICYPKCTTCARAKKLLDENGIEYTERNIKEDNPASCEISEWSEKGKLPLGKFFNTSGLIYRSMGLKDKLSQMTDAEKLELLASDGMLVKRPILVTEDTVLLGFNEEKWKNALI